MPDAMDTQFTGDSLRVGEEGGLYRLPGPVAWASADRGTIWRAVPVG